MKDIAKQQERAGVDVAERVRKLLVEIRPAVQQKYGLTDELMNLVLYSGAALVSVEYAKSIKGMEAGELSDAIREPAPARTGWFASAGSTVAVEWNVADPAENAIRQGINSQADPPAQFLGHPVRLILSVIDKNA